MNQTPRHHLIEAFVRGDARAALEALAPDAVFREGPVGWRSRVIHPACGGLAFWQPKP